MGYMKVILFVTLFGFIASVSGTSANVVSLDYKNISKIYKGDWLAVFHAPGCAPCDKLLAIIPRVAEKIDTSVQIALINAAGSHPIHSQFQVNKFPTVYYVHDGECRMYEGAKDISSLAEYVNSKWTISIPIIGPTAPCGIIMRLFGTYVDLVTRLYGLFDNLAHKFNVDTMQFICVGTVSIMLVFAANAIVFYSKIRNVRVEGPEKSSGGGNGGSNSGDGETSSKDGVFLPDSDSSKSLPKGQKVEISRTATISSKKSNGNMTLNQRRKRRK